MIKEIQVREILLKEFPEMNNNLGMRPNPDNIYATVGCFVDFTRKLIKKGNIKSVKHCFSVAETMLDDGNNIVKNAIENVYVYSLGSVVDLSSSTANYLKKLFNGSLKKGYYRQIFASGV